jgi:hypothetical protein
MGVLNGRLTSVRNRRRSERASVLLPASVVTMSAYQYLELVNLSATGAKLRGSPMPPIGTTALFRLEHLKILCKVVWATDELCGIRFDDLVPPQTLAYFSKEGSPARIGMLTPDEKQAEEEWTNGAAP